MKPSQIEKVKWYITIIIFVVILFNAYLQRTWYVDLLRDGLIQNDDIYLKCDAKEYYTYAMEKNFPCFSANRDPFIVMIGRLALLSCGNINLKSSKDDINNNECLRHTSILISILALCALFALSLILAGRTVALISTLLYSANSWDLFYSVGFLRVDLAIFFNLLILIFLSLLFNLKNQKYFYLLFVLTGFAGGCLFLTRLSSIATFLIIIFSFNLMQLLLKKLKRRDLIGSAIAITIAFLLVLPYLIYSFQNSNSLFSSSNQHAKFWRNQEFAGTPGFLTRREVRSSPYSGEEITPIQYIWGMHSIPEIILRYVYGYFLAFFHYLSRLYVFGVPFIWMGNLLSRIFYISVFPGLILCCFKKERGWFTVIGAFTFLFPFVFILPLNTIINPDLLLETGVEPRFTMPLLPFSFIFSAITFNHIKEMAKKNFIYFLNKNKNQILMH